MDKNLKHENFYSEPTKENLDKLEKSLQCALNEHIINIELHRHVMKKAKEYYDEMQKLR